MFDNDLPTAPPLSARGVRVLAPTGRVLLEFDALDVAPGAAVGIRGPSGAGKSTLLNVLIGLLRPSAGAVRWGDTDIAALSETARDAFRRERVGLVFQDFLLFEELSALDNAAVAALYAPAGRRVAIRERARSALAALRVPHEARDVATLSGGERQRVAVARALATDPAILVADEPTASLDRAAADALVADLVALTRARGRTLLAVSHDPTVIEAMDWVVDVRDGRIAP